MPVERNVAIVRFLVRIVRIIADMVAMSQVLQLGLR
jgi:hypothetical protein